MNNWKVVPGPLNEMVGDVSVAPTCRLLMAIVVLCSLTAVTGDTRGSPLKKLTGTLSVIGRSPVFLMLKYTCIPRLPQIGGMTTTAGAYTPSPSVSQPGPVGFDVHAGFGVSPT